MLSHPQKPIAGKLLNMPTPYDSSQSQDTSKSTRRLHAALRVGTTVSVAGLLVFLTSSVSMVVLWVTFLFESMGWLGIFLGVITAPIAVAYPFVHWFARSEFHSLCFAVWISGIVGMGLSMAWAAWGRHWVSTGSFDHDAPTADENVPPLARDQNKE